MQVSSPDQDAEPFTSAPLVLKGLGSIPVKSIKQDGDSKNIELLCFPFYSTYSWRHFSSTKGNVLTTKCRKLMLEVMHT